MELLKVLSYWNLNSPSTTTTSSCISLKVLSYWNLNCTSYKEIWSK